MEEIILKGHRGSGGKGEGKAMVCKRDVCWFKTVDSKGNVIDKENELYGQNIAGSIFVFPSFKGSTAGAFRLYEMVCKGSAPKAIVIKTADTVTLSGAILGDIPLVHNFEVDPTSVIETGDIVTVDGDKAILRIKKLKR